MRLVQQVKRLLVFFLVSLAGFSTSAQVKSEWKTLQVGEGGLVKIVATDQATYLFTNVWEKSNLKVTVTVYDGAMQQKARKELALMPSNLDPKKTTLLLRRYVPVGADVLIYSVYHSRAENKRIAYVARLAPDGALSTPTVKIGEMDVNEADGATLLHALSPNSQIAAVLISEPKGKEGYAVTVASYNLSTSKAMPVQAFTVPVSPKEFALKQLAINDDGIAAIDAQSEVTSKVFIYNKVLKEATLAAGENFVYSKRLWFEGEELIAAGVFCKQKLTSGNLTKGMRYGNYPDGFVLERFNVKTGTSTKRAEGNLPPYKDDFKDIDLTNTTVQDIHKLSDGTTVMVCEQQVEVLVSSSNGTQTEFHRGPIHLIGVKPDGALAWHTVLLKHQWIRGIDALMSYAWMRKGDNLFFVYNDDKANLNNTSARNIPAFNAEPGGTAIVIAKVDGSGKVTREAATPSGDGKDFRFVDPAVFGSNSDKAYLYARKRTDIEHDAANVSVLIVDFE